MTEYGSGGSFTVVMDGPFGSGGGGETDKITVINTLAGSWKGGTSPYSQVVNVDGISVNSKVDIHMSADQLKLLGDQRITFTVANKAGVVTVYAIGDKPSVDCKFQAELKSILNVSAEQIDEIYGNSISTTSPRSNYTQEDQSKADFILNKPELVDMDAISLTLYAANWSGNRQTVEASKVIADSDKQAVLSVSAPGSLETYLDCNVRMESQGSGTLTYGCDDVPTKDIVVNILILTQGG